MATHLGRRIALAVAMAVVASMMLVAPAETRGICEGARNVEKCCEKKTKKESRERLCIERNAKQEQPK